MRLEPGPRSARRIAGAPAGVAGAWREACATARDRLPGAGPVGGALRTGSTATLAGNLSGTWISARRTCRVPSAFRLPWTLPWTVRCELIVAVSKSLAIGLALSAVMVRSTGIGAARPIVPLAPIVPSPARPLNCAMRRRSPSACSIACDVGDVDAGWVVLRLAAGQPYGAGHARRGDGAGNGGIQCELAAHLRPLAATIGLSKARSSMPPARRSSTPVAASGAVPVRVRCEAPAVALNVERSVGAVQGGVGGHVGGGQRAAGAGALAQAGRGQADLAGPGGRGCRSAAHRPR